MDKSFGLNEKWYRTSAGFGDLANRGKAEDSSDGYKGCHPNVMAFAFGDNMVCGVFGL
jgi:hypothetical protein